MVVASGPLQRKALMLFGGLTSAFGVRDSLYGRVIEREELPQLLDLWHSARDLPAGPKMTFVYLIQGEEDTLDKEAALAGADSDVHVLTFRSRRSTALFFPRSRLGEGRNVLLAAAAMEELKRGYRYDYYVMLDADAHALTSWTRGASER